MAIRVKKTNLSPIPEKQGLGKKARLFTSPKSLFQISWREDIVRGALSRDDKPLERRIPMSRMMTKENLVLGPELAGTLMSPEEFDSAEEWDENYCYELIHGVLVVAPPPAEAERDPNEQLGYLLRSYQELNPKGSALNKTLPEQYVRTLESRRRADRIISAGLEGLPNPKRDVPTIVVEFVSAGKRSRHRDYIEKRKEYMELGVLEYWVFDRFRRTMTVYRKRKNGAGKLVIGERDTYRTPLLPGFELPLARLLALADIWKRL
jgi:Uma2 family endonuclease